MKRKKDEIIESLETAKDELERALANLDKLHTFDPSYVKFIAHALNNYLTIMSLGIELLSEEITVSASEQVKTYVDGLRHATNLMKNNVRKLTNASVIDRENFNRERIDLVTLVQRACTHYQSIADQKQIQIITDFNVDSPYVLTDRIAVLAVLDNLLSNALKYSPQDRRVWVKLVTDKSHLVCTVRDEGPGLNAEDQSKLFQGGVKLSNVPTAGEPSTGYGLAVAKDLVNKLGGDIWCESEADKGASFSFTVEAAF
jgi:signal transduction histidine kinase